MKFTKFSLASLLCATLLLVGCSSRPNTVLNFSSFEPSSKMTFQQTKPNAQTSLLIQDKRSQPEVSAYTFNGELLKLTTSPNVQQLFHQIMKKDLSMKGFKLSNASTSQVVVNIKELYAKVDAGNLHHKISSSVQLEIIVQGSSGNFTKNMGVSRVDEGIFSVSNKDIQSSLNKVLENMVDMLYQDKEVAEAINKYTY